MMAESQVGKEETRAKLPPHQKHKQALLSELSREELEARVKQVEAHNTQLRNLLSKSQTGATPDSLSTHGKSPKQRDFDFSKYSCRHVALKLCYLGWDYQGFTVQEDSHNTIEAQLFAALLKTRLIQSRETSNYHRCGRTDKGVSAFDQVISITLRSKVRKGIGVEGVTQEKDSSTTDRLKEYEKEEEEEEINYVQLLNRVLPQEIRILAWCPVPSEFSARFDCCQRTYKYFFPQGSLDLQAMNQAGQHLVGEHDFRNLCKMDVANGVVNFKRRIMAVRVARMDQKDGEDTGGGSEDVNESPSDGDGYGMCVATIEGQAFLWHQVRAVMAVLFLVGQGKEQPDVVAELLDVKTHPRKPQYCLASDLPLNLWAVHFDGVAWRWDEDELRRLLGQLQEVWTQQAVRNTMTRSMLKDLEGRYERLIRVREKRKGKEDEEKQPGNNEPEMKKMKRDEENNEEVKMRMEEEDEGWRVKEQPAVLMSGNKCKVYRPLLTRPTCESLEKRVEHYIKKQRLDPELLKKLD
ncbi:tRNA pseudouridine(38/39) synthase-like [Portunus trituberculatus]|uniref:tRNA pseudouridine(38/39) synthase-like n=1 Tax=Portunus trituberculatus TaxID=210409 RepID=UPI001E1D11B5|nr:tRNA pseudouridine(38/39) synthase-like [Portunus trituberculatus]